MEEREWTVNGSKINMQEIDALSVDPAQDFLVVIGTPLAPHVPGAEELVLRFLSLSDCQPHPLAQRNNCSFETDFCSRCYVEGDLVGHDATLPAEMTILVWNWKTGDLLWQADGRGYDTFSFVDDRLILALRAQGHEVDIFELDPSNERMCFPTVMYGARCTFTLPQRVYADLDSTAWPFIGTHYMSGLSRRDPSRPFYPSARRDLVVHFSTCMASSSTSAMLVPVHAIRSWVREAKNGSIGDDDQNMDRYGSNCLGHTSENLTDNRISDEDDTGDDVEYKYADHDVNNAEAEADVRWPLWITRYPRVLGRGPPCCAEVQGMHATIANIENAEGDGYELRVTFLDYTAVGGKSFDFTAKNLTAWRHGDLGDLPLYSEGVHTALVRADDILVYDAPRRGDVVVIPDYALLQQCKVDGRYRWQIYYITSPDSDEDDVRLT
ncbi:predicted protein [Postia placenta Mad-698-R]|nr:predicted protein [Postia placenta Mad-698-R]